MTETTTDHTAAATPDPARLSPGPGTSERASGPESHPPGNALHRRFVLRVASLPVEAVHGLRDPEASGWAESTLDAAERVAAVAERLAEPLTALVTATGEDRARRAVLAVRREVFNGRMPGDAEAVRALARTTGGAAGELLERWLDARLELAAAEAAGEGVVARGLAAARGRLRELAREDRLRLGLLLASPTLDGQLDAYISDAAPVPDKRGRKKERSLLSYLYRTACKTSPFSTFTAVATGEFRPAPAPPAPPRPAPAPDPDPAPALDPAPASGQDPDPDRDVPVGGSGSALGEERSSHPRLNVVVLARLAELIAADPARRADLPVTLSAGWDLDDDRLRFVRRSVTAGDDTAAVSFDAAHDRLFFLRRKGVLDRMIGLFADGAAPRGRELEAWLAAETGAPPEEAARYLATLLDLGVLQTAGLHTDVHAPDPLRSFQAALRSLDRPWAGQAAAALDAVGGCVGRYAAAGLHERRGLLRELRAALDAVRAGLGAGRVTLPQTLLYEDVSAGPVTADPRRWTGLAAEPLDSLTRILPAFDVSLPQRLTLKGFFLARYGRGGRCEDVLRLVHDFHEDIFSQYLQFTSAKSPYAEDGSYVPEENWLGMPEVAALDRGRAELGRRMRRLWAEHPAGAAELRLDEDTVDAVAAELAPLRPSFAPHSHFLQLAERPGDPLVVLNNSYGGLAFPFTRFTHCFDPAPDPSAPAAPDGSAAPGLTAELRGRLRGWQPPGAVFAEVTAGAATTNLNLHGRLTDHEIVCPGETSTAPPEARIDLGDLYAEHDEAQDRLLLRSRRLRREVVPLYLGYLVPMVLPEVPRTLLLFSPTSRARPDLWRGVPESPAVDGVTTRPRVRYRSLVLHRQGWSARPGALPVRAKGQGDAAYFLDWRRWRRRHGLPGQVFATVRAEGAAQGPFGGGAKPAYVDFDSPLSLLALEALTGGGSARTDFEEMLPAAGELHLGSARGRHVAELAVEIVPRAAAPRTPRPGRQDPRP